MERNMSTMNGNPTQSHEDAYLYHECHFTIKVKYKLNSVTLWMTVKLFISRLNMKPN